MHPKMRRWIRENGKRLIELKVMGAEEYFKQERDKAKLEQLDGHEWVEFFTLNGQFEAMIWAFAPKKNPEKFFKELEEVMRKLEESCRRIYDLTGQTRVIRGDERWSN